MPNPGVAAGRKIVALPIDEHVKEAVGKAVPPAMRFGVPRQVIEC